MSSENFPHDAAYKAFFSNPEMVKSLLLDFVPEDFIKDFDFDTLEACSGSYTTDDLQQRHDDIVWRVRWKDNWCYIYILLEFQSSQDHWMALRIAIYTGLLWQELVRKGLVQAGESLPPVLPIVVYNGEKAWSAPLSVSELVDQIHSGLTKYQLNQEYFLLDENRIAQLLLDEAQGNAGFIFKFERANDAKSIMDIYQEFMGRVSDQKFAFLRRSIRAWLVRLMRKKNIVVSSSENEEEDNIMLEQKFRQWEQEFIEKGKAEGLVEGKAEGLAEGLGNQKMTLFEMLSDRFEIIPDSWREAINCLTDPHAVGQLTREIYKVKSADDFGLLLTQKVTPQ